MLSTPMLLNDKWSESNNPAVQVTVTENTDGRVTFEIVQLEGVPGDEQSRLRGYFFDFFDG